MLLLLLSSALCESRYEFSVYGGMKELFTNDDHYVEFGVAFNDFGHTVQVQAWDINDQPLTIKYSYGPQPINFTTAETLDKSIIYLNDPSQYAVFAIKSPMSEKGYKIVISLVSTVRPVNVNSSTTLIFGFHLFFGIIFVITGVLQFIYFQQAMDPREYQMKE